MIGLILSLAKEFHYNPLVIFGVVFTAYGLLGFHKINTQLHKKKDEEIEKLKKENDKLREEKFELELKRSFKNQSGMIYFNEEEME